jgi:hypothetical protein
VDGKKREQERESEKKKKGVVTEKERREKALSCMYCECVCVWNVICGVDRLSICIGIRIVGSEIINLDLSLAFWEFTNKSTSFTLFLSPAFSLYCIVRLQRQSTLSQKGLPATLLSETDSLPKLWKGKQTFLAMTS